MIALWIRFLSILSRNEELDDKAVIKKLKRRVIDLERELTTLRETGVSPTQVNYMHICCTLIVGCLNIVGKLHTIFVCNLKEFHQL